MGGERVECGEEDKTAGGSDRTVGVNESVQKGERGRDGGKVVSS